MAGLGGAIQVLLEYADSTEVREYFRDQYCYYHLLEKLKTELPSLAAVVDDAEEKQNRSEAVRAWLYQLRDDVYNAEDCMDEIRSLALRDRLETGSQVADPVLPFCHKVVIGTKVAKIVNSIVSLAKRRGELCLRERIGYGTKQSPIKAPSYFGDDNSEVVFGRESDKQAIIDLLLSDDASAEKLFVIPIMGEIGIGKTTLARLVFSDHKVSLHFYLKAWVQVPDTFDELMVTKAIFESLTSQACHLKDLKSLQVILQESLSRKKILLVLDDVTDCYKNWQFLLPLFEGAANGSSVIITTRMKSVISFVGKVSAYHMRGLSTTECWSLFAKFAFGDQSLSSYPKLEAIGRQIAHTCHGLPSAVRALGAALHFKRQVEEWSAILDSLENVSLSGTCSDIVNHSFQLSYYQLPAHLKRCFAYCSILPPSNEFQKERLVLLWMAEGLLHQPRADHRMEEVGDEYFQELLFRSFFQQSSGNKSCFVMHRPMNDLAILVSGGYGFRLEDNNLSHISSQTRYLSFLPDLEGEDKKRIEFGRKGSSHSFVSPSNLYYAINKAKFLRTLFPLANESRHISYHDARTLLSSLQSSLQFLRVLSLSHYQITALPASICKLQHLRYIDLSHTTIKILPEPICALSNLQTLILSNCHSLTRLPINMWMLINLRHLDISGTNLNEMPYEMSRLESLQTLSNFVVGEKSGSSVRELGGLLYLHGTLHISKLQNMVSAKDAAEARLVEKTCLDELVLEWGDYTVDPENNRDVLEQLVPHTNLKKLSIKFYVGTRFPPWLGDFSFSNMVFLRLSNCKNCLDLPPLGQLSFLKVLIIEWMNAVKRVGPEFYGIDKPFRSLETLTFEGMMEWEEWVSFEVNVGEFPFLRELCIRRCPKLKNLPKIFPSIVKVEIFESMELVTTLIIDELSRKRLLHYNDKVLFISEDKVTSFSELVSIFTNTGATESSTTLGASLSLYFRTRGAPESSLLKTQDAAESSLPTTQGSTESSLPITQGATEYSLPITLGATEYSLPITQGPTEYSLPITQGATESTEDDVRNNTWSNQDGLQDLSFESIKVSRMSQLMGLTGIHSLKIERCDALEFIPVEVMDRNPFLQHLYFINCGSFKSFPRGHPPTALKFLYIQNCKKLEFLPPTKRTHQFALEHLCIGSSCDSLKFLPLDFFPELRSLSIWDCANLHSLSVTDGIQKDLTCLEALEIRDCPNLVSFPNGGLPTPNLTSIWISNCMNLKELPHKLYTLNSLESMLINNCPKLISLPKGGLPSNLSILCITFCDELMPGMEWGLHRLDCLSRLEIEGGCKNLVSFPEEKLLPSNLNSLRISGLLNLKYLNYKGLQHLTALKTLEISCCNKLRSFPEESLPSSLSFLCINECSLLESKLHNKRKRFG